MSSTPTFTEVQKAAKAYEEAVDKLIDKLGETKSNLAAAAIEIGGPDGKKNKKKVEVLDNISYLCEELRTKVVNGRRYTAFCGEQYPSLDGA
jgi:hypothetical protein